MKSKLFFSVFFLSTWICFAQAPGIEWGMTSGGSQEDLFRKVSLATDGGYVAFGHTFSNDGDITGNHGIDDCLIVKYDSMGGVEWSKTYGGSSKDQFWGGITTSDGGYLGVGLTFSTDGDVSQNNGQPASGWIVKTDASGEIEWEKSIGDITFSIFTHVLETPTGDFILGGNIFHPALQANDAWIVKIDNSGNILWENTYGGSIVEDFLDIQPTSDGGYIAVGGSQSSDGDVSGNNNGILDGWIVKTDASGVIEWENNVGGSEIDVFQSVIQTLDGGFVVVGRTLSNDGDISGNHGGQDGWVVKYSNSGGIEWQKLLGGSNDDNLTTIKEISGQGFIVAGNTASSDGDVSNNQHGDTEGWIVKLNYSGTIEWETTKGGNGHDSFNHIQQTQDNGFILCGVSYSSDGDITTVNQGAADAWVIKLDPLLAVKDFKADQIALYPNPASQKLNVASTNGNIKNLAIYDHLGRTVAGHPFTGNPIDVSGLSPGVYFIELLNAQGQSFIKKFIKE